MRLHRVRVGPLPPWLELPRLLGEGAFQLASRGDSIEATAELAPAVAADLEARLRGVVLAGRRVACEVIPRLARPLVRRARLEDARRRRARSAGLSRPGVVLDDAMRLGLTPEELALALGERARALVRAGARPARVIDACCGAGGNAIGFARSGLDVLAIELDPERLAAARVNARVYGVSDRITFVAGDARELLPRHEAALWFVDAPWSERTEAGHLPLLAELIALRPEAQALWTKVPADFDPALVPGCTPTGWFGAAGGDAQRVKFLLLELGGYSRGAVASM